jgi:hypothetical protein
MPFVYDSQRGVYLDGGQPVPAATVRAAVQHVVDGVSDG